MYVGRWKIDKEDTHIQAANPTVLHTDCTIEHVEFFQNKRTQNF